LFWIRHLQKNEGGFDFKITSDFTKQTE